MDNINEFSEDEDFIELAAIVIEYERKPREYRNRPDHFQIWNDQEFKHRFRLSKESTRFLVEEIREQIALKTDRNHALSPTEMVFVALRFLATGSMLRVAADFNGIDVSTASRVVAKVIRAIASLSRSYIRMPNPEEVENIRNGFYGISKFPRCIGAVDCTHVKIRSPGGPEPENYRNRKRYFSFNVQMVCDSKLRIQNVVCRWPGASHDSNIFKNSALRRKFENGEFGDSLLLGDSGYGIKKYLITPLASPQTPAEHLFNEAQIRTRNPVERCFGVLKRRFPILALGINLKVEKVEAVVVATAVLHNIALQLHDEEPTIDDETLELINWTNDMEVVPVRQDGGIDSSVRHALINDYFQGLLNNLM